MRRAPMAIRVTLAVLALAGTMALAACGGDDNGGGGGETSAGGKKIALLLPESKTTRYEEQDRPNFERKMHELCPDCEILYSNAQQDPAKQQQQAEAAITNGADVLVLDAVDAASAKTIVDRAKQSDIPVVAYDRLITDADLDAYVSFDNVRVGEVQAKSLLEAIGGPDGKTIVMVNGAPTDHSATEYKQGAHTVFDPSGVKIAKEYDTPDWSPDKAQREMEQALTAVGGKDGFDGVYSANDGMASGIIAALEGAKIDPSTKPITGQDAEVTAVQRLLTGDQHMTIYLRIRDQAETAAEIANALAKGEPLPKGVDAKVDNGAKQVPSVLLAPVPVTKDEVADTIVKDGFLTADQICTKAYAQACAEAGIQ